MLERQKDEFRTKDVKNGKERLSEQFP